ncbi:LOW QUALITY PROTEIN: hypothetical protein RJ641_001750 [Dillenia turbinata]|uniref:Uncharacterized protein n=1 Tax=Dillenia turbinata TaxID=194707 RepID=A0AAN8VLW1_9MAGN
MDFRGSLQRSWTCCSRRPSQFLLRCSLPLGHLCVRVVTWTPHPASLNLRLGLGLSIPGRNTSQESTASRVRAGRSPAPTGESVGAPSYGKSPGSRRRNEKPEASGAVTEESVESSDPAAAETEMMHQRRVEISHLSFGTWRKRNYSGYDLDKKLGRPHAFIDPKKKKPIEEPLTSISQTMAENWASEALWKEPTLTEASLYRARRHLFKEERLQTEPERLEKEGPMAYCSEWHGRERHLREAIQKYFEETGENENSQLIEILEISHYDGTDVRIRRDPLAMSMPEDQIKQIWRLEISLSYCELHSRSRSSDWILGVQIFLNQPQHVGFLKEHGKIISREELEQRLAKEKTEEIRKSQRRTIRCALKKQ